MFTLIFEYVVVGLYLLALVVVVLYSFGQLHLIYTFLHHRSTRPKRPPLQGDEDLPFVTIQLPIFNEMYVVERLLEATAAQDYPLERFEIQLLDDSTDETVDIAAEKIAELQARGVQVTHVRRPDRVGFKAGALAYGLEFAKGEFVAIFDADFLPNPDFLRGTLSYFDTDEVGLVQARWEHINQHYSLFTEVQAFHLDAHFTLEQYGRYRGGYCMNFNGTAGVWRKSCIEDAGGWEADTLTEDLDLSYRAQLKGWRFVYVDEVGAPAELPAELSAIKSQQYRWMKGGAEVAAKMLGQVWRSPISFAKKIHASLHLLSSSIFIMVLLLGAMSVPLLYIKHAIMDGKMGILVYPISLLISSFFILIGFYVVTMWHREKDFTSMLKRLVFYYVPFLSFSMGLSLHNSIAVIEGYMGKKTPFIRTPKFNITKRSDSWNKAKYQKRKLGRGVYGEIFLFFYFCFGIGMSFYFDDMAITPFFLMQAFGFGSVGLMSIKHSLGIELPLLRRRRLATMN
ncbi:MAG: cellulose synthase family protein [Bacteroidota bacterium]